MSNKKQTNVIKFADVKDQIVTELRNPSRNFEIEEQVTIFEGIINQPFCTELSGSIQIGGPTVPMIMLIGKSGRLYFLALKAILPTIEL